MRYLFLLSKYTKVIMFVCVFLQRSIEGPKQNQTLIILTLKCVYKNKFLMVYIKLMAPNCHPTATNDGEWRRSVHVGARALPRNLVD